MYLARAGDHSEWLLSYSLVISLGMDSTRSRLLLERGGEGLHFRCKGEE